MSTKINMACFHVEILWGFADNDNHTNPVVIVRQAPWSSKQSQLVVNSKNESCMGRISEDFLVVEICTRYS